MTTLIKHKRVEFSELFYDLVFVFNGEFLEKIPLIYHGDGSILVKYLKYKCLLSSVGRAVDS